MVLAHSIFDLVCGQQESVHNLAVRTDLDGLKVGPRGALARHHGYLLLMCKHELLLGRVPRCARIVTQSVRVGPVHGIEVPGGVADQQ